ncbi:MAG: undecaprenyldiphospho-muramoylpentapeptide beta-N-acetylglucosaminyltransferase [Spirochaetota bacterium]
MDLVLFSGGGTGGHVYPGLAVLDRVRELGGVEVAWIGSIDGMERGIVTDHAVAYHAIPAGKLRRYFSLRNAVDVFRVAGGLLRSLAILRRLRPAVLFSKGGFVSVPPVVAARLLGIPVISHESDADPGLATRINARFSSTVLVPYEQTREHLPPALRERVVVTGNPLRPEILSGRRERGLAFLGFEPSDPRPVVCFLGGSLGALQLNDAVAGLAARIEGSWRVVHQSGNHAVARENGTGYHAAPFFGAELPDVLAAADLLVCRAGASTIWEGAALGKPMLLVPLASGSRGDQLRNAAVFERAGAARVFTDAESLEDDLVRALDELVSDPATRREMGRRAKQVVRLDATGVITDLIAAHIRSAPENPPCKE